MRVLLAAAAFAEEGDDQGTVRRCGTVVTEAHVAYIRNRLETGVYDDVLQMTRRGGETWMVPLTIHVVRMSDGTGGLTELSIEQGIWDLNVAFGPSGLEVYRQGNTRFIDDDDFYLNINTDSEIDALRSTDVVCGTVNIYYTQNLADEEGSMCGRSSFFGDPVQGIVLRNDCIGTVDNPVTFPQEVGHYFNLYHTHETTFDEECVDGSNCDDAGDLICDTPADPKLGSNDDCDAGDPCNIDSSCQYVGNETDSCNDDPYAPLTWNLMSYSPKTCRTDFTLEQIGRALLVHQNLQSPEFSYITCGCGQMVWVDVNATPHDHIPGGTQVFPFLTVREAFSVVCSGGTLFVKSGYYGEATLVIDQPMTIRARGGTVEIGS